MDRHDGLQDSCNLVSCPDPALTRREKGLVTIERYLGCAESAVLLSIIPPVCYVHKSCSLCHMNKPHAVMHTLSNNPNKSIEVLY